MISHTSVCMTSDFSNGRCIRVETEHEQLVDLIVALTALVVCITHVDFIRMGKMNCVH